MTSEINNSTAIEKKYTIRLIVLYFFCKTIFLFFHAMNFRRAERKANIETTESAIKCGVETLKSKVARIAAKYPIMPAASHNIRPIAYALLIFTGNVTSLFKHVVKIARP